jgi:hypothetical protein
VSAVGRLDDVEVGRPRCAHYGEIVGVYEPARLLVPDGSDRHGSPLTLGDQIEAPGSTVLHERCHEPFERARSQGRSEREG